MSLFRFSTLQFASLAKACEMLTMNDYYSIELDQSQSIKKSPQKKNNSFA